MPDGNTSKILRTLGSQSVGTSAKLTNVYNNTTSVAITAENESIPIHEILSDGLRIQFKSNLCSHGHLLSFRFLFQENEKSFDMQATAKIVEHQKTDQSSANILLKFYQIDNQTWTRFQRYMDRKQTKVEDLFKKLRDF